jgi:hypothetical protein
MKVTKTLIFYLILTSLGGQASKIADAYKALSIYDYFKAKKLFYSQLKKGHKAAAAYGLAVIYHRSDNPFSNIDSASRYISLSGNYYRSERLKESYFGFEIDSISIMARADSIGEKALRKANKTNSTFAYEAFLTSNAYASYRQKYEALYLRDELCYKTNLAYNKSDSTMVFMLRYPESFFYKEFYTLRDKQLFEENTPLRTPEQYNAFIAKFPKNKFVGQAQDELFDIYKKNNDLQGLDFYVNNYRNSHFINEAWKLLYALTVKSYNNEELQSFVRNYPDFPFKASINKEIELNNRNLILVNDNDQFGFTDTTGKFLIDPVYDEASVFREGLAVVNKGDSVFFINKENENVFGNYYKEAFSFTSGYAPVNMDGNWFLINRQGQKAAGPFEDISEQSENIYIVKLNGKFGAIDVYGNSLISPQFDGLGDFKNGFAYYLNAGQYGFVDRNGHTSKPVYQWISDFDEHKIAIVKLNNLYGLVNSSDSILLEPAYDLVLKAENNVFLIVKNNKYGFYSGRGCIISFPEYEYKKELPPSYYTNGKLFKLLKTQQGSKTTQQALMDMNGRIAIDYGTYEEVNFAKDQLIRIKKKNKYGFVDRKLNNSIPCKYNSATDFNEGLSICTLKQESLLINTKGEIVFKSLGEIVPAASYFLVKEESGDKLVDKNGNIVLTGVENWQISPEAYLVVDLENKSRKIFKL